MGYSTSAKTIEAIKEYLKPLEEGRPWGWDLETGGDHTAAGRWAHKVREALYIAHHYYPDKYPALAQAHLRFTIKVASPTRVEAIPALNTAVGAIVGQGSVTTHGVAPAGNTGQAGSQTALTIIDYWRRAQPTNTPLHFPNAALSDEDLNALYRWCQSRTPKMMFMKYEDSITLSMLDEEAVSAAWHP